MDQTEVVNLATLPFARGKVGQREPLLTEEDMIEFARRQAEHIIPLTITNTAYCGDERLTIALADGTQDLDKLRDRIVPQLFGGIGLGLTKAMIAADALSIRGAKNFWDAFIIVSDKLLKDEREEDAAHEECGADLAVESSVENEIELSSLIPAIGLLVPDDGRNGLLIGKNAAIKRARLNDGFYGGWDPLNHQDYVIDRYPHNFSYLKTDPNDHETHGHNGRGLVVVSREGYGYQKTGEAFAMTLPKAKELAFKFGVDNEERRRILLGFVDDSLHVGAGIVAKDFPVFVQAV